ncbi:hypothetical protein ACHQM5_022799 [Ranunculus cassubicifolius]
MATVFFLRIWVVLLSVLACTLHFMVLSTGFESYKSDIRLYYLTCSIGVLKLVTLCTEFQNYFEVYMIFKSSLTLAYFILTASLAIICKAGVDVLDSDLWTTFLFCSIFLTVDGLLSVVQFTLGLHAAMYQKPSSTSPSVMSKLPNVSWFLLGRAPRKAKKIPKDDKLD